MIKLPRDKYGNEGWVVKARKAHRCADRDYGCKGGIEKGSYYYRGIAWPGTDANSGDAPWVLKFCRSCLHEEMGRAFDAIVSPQMEPTALQMRTGPWRDIHGDVWTLGEDELLHTPETRPFSREHVEKKWGPLILAEPPTKPVHPPLSTTGGESDTPTHTERESAGDEGQSA